MIKRRDSRAYAIMTLLLVASMTSRAARAGDGGVKQSKPIRLYATIPFGPIGTVMSVSGVKINGRTLYGDQAIWRGDRIQAPFNTGAFISLDSIGQITLKTGTAMTIATTLSGQDDETVQRVLVATITEGEILVRLRPEASAHIETDGSVISADIGACFRLSVTDQEAQVDAFAGEVYVVPQVQFSYNRLRPVEREPLTGNVRKPAPKTTYVPPRQSRPLSVQAKTRGKPVRISSKLMPTMDEPAKNLRIRFTLDNPTIGQLDPVEDITNEYGVATTNFTAGSNRGESRFIATVVDNPVDRYVGKIVVGKAPGIFRLRNILIGAGAIAATVLICCARHKDPKNQDPPIIIEP